MRNRKLLPIALAALVATGSLAGAQPAAAVKVPSVPGFPRIPKLPNLPRAPKVTTYKATLDVAGYVGVKVERDDTGDCRPGQDVTLEFESSFELGGPRATAVTIVNGALVTGIVANRGGVSHSGELAAYHETNYCPPARRVELIKPTCTSGRGKLRANLGSAVEDVRGDDDPTPLAHPVNVVLTRFGGASQDESCRTYLSSGMRASVRPERSELSAFEWKASGLVLPLGAHEWDFMRLEKGGWLRRVITLNGACNHVLIGRAPAADASARDRSRCTVTGRIYVGVKRVS